MRELKQSLPHLLYTVHLELQDVSGIFDQSKPVLYSGVIVEHCCCHFYKRYNVSVIVHRPWQGV